MTPTRDAFLDALTMPSAPVRRQAPMTHAQRINARQDKVWDEAKRLNPEKFGNNTAIDPFTPKISARPDFADDIDRIVAEMVAAGEVVFDAEARTFKTPPRKRMRFA